MLYGGIETGGTKIVCAVGTSPMALRAETSFPTTTPDETLARIIAFFQQQLATPLAAVGIGSFGPISLDCHALDYGYITSTPKPGWAHTDMVNTVEQALNVPVGFDTDVSVAALGEGRWGNVSTPWHVSLPHYGHWYRRWRSQQRSIDAWADSSRDGAYSSATRQEGRPFPRYLAPTMMTVWRA